QRTFQADGRLAKERAARLTSLTGWVWGLQNARWDDGFAVLQQFVSREGHARVPRDHSESGFLLGGWVKTQRRAQAAGRLSDERAARLAALPKWAWSVMDAQWDDSFALLEQFVARENHAQVSQDHVEDGLALGDWVGRQRGLYRAGKLSNAR